MWTSLLIAGIIQIGGCIFGLLHGYDLKFIIPYVIYGLINAGVGIMGIWGIK